MNQKGFANIVIIILVVILVGAAGYFYWAKKTMAPLEQTQTTNTPPTIAVFSFDSDIVSVLPKGFVSSRTGSGKDGTWVVLSDLTAPSGKNVLAQTAADSTDSRFPMAVATQGKYQNLELSVKFKPVSGRVDQAGGLVFRYQDAGNYYLVRANALENNYNLYHVIGGQRVQFAGANLAVTANQWHTLKVVMAGNHIEAYFNGQKSIDAHDNTFQDAGFIGVWTKADSVTYFDDLEVKGQ